MTHGVICFITRLKNNVCYTVREEENSMTILRLAKLLLFYIIFYACLAAFAALMFKIFLNTLDSNKPKWTLDESLIGTNPGITVRPVLNDNPIEYRAGDSDYMRMWNEKLTEFLEPYLSGTRSENVQNCFHQQYPDSGKVCNVKLTSEFTPCLPPYNFGFDFDNSDKGPCIFLKLNKIFDWVPKYYHKENIPADMPTELAQKIINAELVNQHDKIWVDCRPNNVSDVGNLGDVSYYPQQGFEGKYFPYTNVEGYLSPLVAVHFEKPKRGIPFDIVCKAWAANIQHDRKYNKGLVRFTLHVH